MVWALLSVTLLWVATAMAASPEARVDELLAGPEPRGIVFEVVEWDIDQLQAVMPRIEALVARVRARRPNLPVVVMSHGEEQFGFMQGHLNRRPQLRSIVEALHRDDVVIQVCGGYAVMSGYDSRRFTPLVTPVAEAVGALAQYRRDGYAIVAVATAD
ncbi:MAG: hypothetical protein U5S82_23310 [Gammaproteobacteria bacterium]|nr:hypothetical protein [Gammaproteobacteria bacterium]